MTTAMTDRLSAYIDGELAPAEAAEVARRIEDDPDLRAEYEALRKANAAALEDFAAMLAAPVPLGIARAIGNAKPSQGAAAPQRTGHRPLWAAIAAGIVCLAVGAGAGWLAAPGQPQRDWIAEIGEYHAVYAAQTRHLVEVPASEADHIVAWLSDQVGARARIPDLTAQGLTFEGARLLVAGGKPVGQLMYRDADGTVVAVCFTASDKPPTDTAQPRPLGEFAGLVWGEPGLRWVVIGPEGYPALGAIAEAARAA